MLRNLRNGRVGTTAATATVIAVVLLLLVSVAAIPNCIGASADGTVMRTPLRSEATLSSIVDRQAPFGSAIGGVPAANRSHSSPVVPISDSTPVPVPKQVMLSLRI